MTSPKRRLDNARAQAELRRREEQRGLARVTVTIPETRRDDLRRIVREWTEPNLNVAEVDTGDQ
jgi:hypothetical protein